ncbi:uncharacterized protein LOC116773871 isoform X2 [Danaus plexippus]|uniref:uncharacterized protein LOC116773871 isoform X2 n=1 Tax=Danaus plexippus TaxID=13037 RepID=UPI0013C4C1A9|nr:uncharacterized protein LOC116773871 isoform X2 [Danaus plexippus]
MKKTSSLVWRFFDRLEENKRCVAVLCKLCDSQYKYFGNTTNLRTHLVNKHPIQWDLLQNGTLDESAARAYDEDDSSSSKRRKYIKAYKDDNVLDHSETENETTVTEVVEEPINIVRQMHGSRASDEEWLNEDMYQTVETYEPKKKKMKYRTIKREVSSPPHVSKYVVHSPASYPKQERIVIDNSQRKDEYSVFGEYVGNKLRKFKSNQTRGNVQQLITTILWQAEYGVYDSMETIKRVLLHSVQDMETVPQEQIIVHNIVEDDSLKVDEN